MNRFARAALVAVVAISGLWAGRLALPFVTLACSCAIDGAPSLHDLFEKPGLAVLSGRVISIGQAADQFGHTRGVLAVERVFKGDIPFNRIPVIGGGGGDCTMALTVGQHFVTAASMDAAELTPMMCMPYGELGTPEGLAVLAEAQAVFGPGVEPPPAPGQATDPPAVAGPSSVDLALPVILLAVAAATVAIFGWIVVRARQSGQAPQ